MVARKRKAGDELNNLRKRWKRAVRRAERTGQTERAKELEHLISISKYDRGLGKYGTSTRSFASIALEAEGLRGLVQAEAGDRTAKVSREAKSNRAFREGLRAARQGIPNDSTRRVGSAAEMEYGVFALATRSMWEQVPGGSRNQLAVVAAQLGMSEQEAYEFVLSQNAEALSRIDELSAQLAEYDAQGDVRNLMSGVSRQEEFQGWYNSVAARVVMFR